MGTPRKRGATIAATSLVAVALAASPAPPARAEADAGACDAFDVEYALAANLTLKETPMGAGDGTYVIGPGRVVLRIARDDAVTMTSYAMRELFEISSTALFWTTHVTTDSRTGAIPDACRGVGEGALAGRVLRWTSALRGYHTDGTITCDGSLCGKFGAPPPGESPLHIAPHPVTFSPFVFSPDGKTFTMASTFVAKTEMPKQTAYLALAGREVRRTCAPVESCK